MSVNYPDLPNTVFPNSIDTYITYMDEDINTKPYIDQINTYVVNGDFDSAKTVMNAHPELQKIIINASVMQKYMDMGIAMERTLSNTVAQIMSLPKYIGEYNSTIQYQMFNCVSKNYIGYMCINSNTPIGTDVSNPTYWVRQSFVGPAGLSLTPFYSYDNTYSYTNTALVPYNNQFYMSLQNNNLNHQPNVSPDWWKIVFQGVTQIIASTSQPTGQDNTQFWFETNSTDSSFKVMQSAGNSSYTQLMPISNADFISNGSKNSIITTLACTKSGTIYALTGLTATSGIATCIFKADADYAAGNTFTVGGTAYTVVTSGGEVLRDGAFLSGDIVGVKLDIDAKKLYIRQDSAAQVGAVRQLAEITQAILDNPTIGYCYIGSVGPDLTGLPLNQRGMISCFATGILCQQTIYYTNATYIRFGFNIWGTWQRINDGGHAASADAASGSIALTAPGLRNNVISSAAPSGGSEGDTWDQV